MRSLARRVGAALRREVGFGGPFTVDGVLTAEGFLPTELNPRCEAGLQAPSGGLSDMPLQTLIAAISAGIDLDYRPPELESLLVDRADGHRAGGTWRAVPGKAPEILGTPRGRRRRRLPVGRRTRPRRWLGDRRSFGLGRLRFGSP
jgi:hypothetical protein